jgi:hypothetical protein
MVQSISITSRGCETLAFLNNTRFDAEASRYGCSDKYGKCDCYVL